MNYQEFKLFSKTIFNNLSWDDFYEAGKSMDYSDDYIETIWSRFSNNRLNFLYSHDMGEVIFNMIMNKINANKILNQDR